MFVVDVASSLVAYYKTNYFPRTVSITSKKLITIIYVQRNIFLFVTSHSIRRENMRFFFFFFIFSIKGFARFFHNVFATSLIYQRLFDFWFLKWANIHTILFIKFFLRNMFFLTHVDFLNATHCNVNSRNFRTHVSKTICLPFDNIRDQILVSIIQQIQ